MKLILLISSFFFARDTTVKDTTVLYCTKRNMVIINITGEPCQNRKVDFITFSAKGVAIKLKTEKKSWALEPKKVTIK